MRYYGGREDGKGRGEGERNGMDQRRRENFFVISLNMMSTLRERAHSSSFGLRLKRMIRLQITYSFHTEAFRHSLVII